ncbi:MAG: DUF1800 family protein [Acidiferrobacterales bacterium]|nr:DUF1800 family protein [Acidiferrobacterales bacterium]
MRILSAFTSSKAWFVASFSAVFLSVSPIQKAAAQSGSSDGSNVITIINSLLLDTGIFSLDVDQVSNQRFGYQYGSNENEEGLDIHFEGQSESVTFCFNTTDIQLNEVTVFINDHPSEIGVVSGEEYCIDVAASLQIEGENILHLVHSNPGERWGVSHVGLEFTQQEPLGLTRVSRPEWDEAAVRKVLKVFAFGGQATDATIQEWANTNPEIAIAQMLNFSEHNLLLAPLLPGEKYTAFANDHGTFTGFLDYISSNDSMLPNRLDEGDSTSNRRRYAVGSNRSRDREASFIRMASTRGLNPFRQRIGLWETNYHLAVNLDTAVDDRQLVKYYDVIMEAHESGVPYKDVIGAAAKSAAVAKQYGHDRNRWSNGNCFCNDDFAREIHQLFYGIFGDEDPENNPSIEGNDHHENVTIPQTARMLTDMPVNNVEYTDDEGNPAERSGDTVTFGVTQHHLAPLDILNTDIVGANAAEKIDYLMNFSIEHPEALKNLPIMIISGLADDNIGEDTANQLRAAWASMGANKNFLEFIQAYAISDLFHSPDQRKYFTTFERGLYMANKNYLSNTESLLDVFQYSSTFDDEIAELFVPAHNVFGGQTSLEAAESPTIFEETYNRYTNSAGNRSSNGFLMRSVECDDCDFGEPWAKDWGAVIPTTNGQHIAEDVAKWLWNHVYGSLDNYGPAERAYFLPLIGTWRIELDDPNDNYQDFFDLNHLMCIREDYLDQNPGATVSLTTLLDDDNTGYRDYCLRSSGQYSMTEMDALQRVYTEGELDPDNDAEKIAHVTDLLDEIGAQVLTLNSGVPQARQFANERIQWALTFLFSTPYIFAEETKR